MLLEVRNMEVKYGEVKCLHGISLEVDAGMVCCLLGPNGAGKTTTLKAISGTIPLSAGEIRLEGQRIDGLPPHQVVKKGIVHVPEGRRVFPDMSVLENLELGAYLQKDRQIIKDGLEGVLNLFPPLKGRLRQVAKTLSGGEQQMLAVGRGLMGKPRLLLMDEPTLGMSPLLCQATAEWLLKIGQVGVTVLLAEQNTKVAFKVSQKGYVMETGKISLQGTTEELLTNDLVRKAYLGI